MTDSAEQKDDNNTEATHEMELQAPLKTKATVGRIKSWNLSYDKDPVLVWALFAMTILTPIVTSFLESIVLGIFAGIVAGFILSELGTYSTYRTKKITEYKD